VRRLPVAAGVWAASRSISADESGAVACRQARLLNEIVIHLAPVLLGDGVRLHDSTGPDPITVTRTALATTGQLTDLRFRASNRTGSG